MGRRDILPSAARDVLLGAKEDFLMGDVGLFSPPAVVPLVVPAAVATSLFYWGLKVPPMVPAAAKRSKPRIAMRHETPPGMWRQFDRPLRGLTETARRC
jgi:hypothetical protein